MNSAFNVTKDPNSDLDYTLNWGPWLLDGDTILESTWTTADPPAPPPLGPGVVLHDPAIDPTRTKAVVWMSGGTNGHAYQVVNQITTVARRVERCSIWVQISPR